MSKILFIVNAGEISSNANGGASVLYSHLELLHACGHEVILLTTLWNDTYVYNEEDYKEITHFVSSIHQYTIHTQRPKKNLKRLYDAVFDPATFEYYFLNSTNTTFLEDFVAKQHIDLVWCEWRWTAIWAWKTKLSIPVLYAHHDWEYKLALLRNKPTLNKRFHTFQKKRVEMMLVKQVTACISGSATETEEIIAFSRKKALYLPTTYTRITPKQSANATPVLVHLGGMGTTANRIGLERFLEVCWEKLTKELPDIRLKVIGSTKRAHPSLAERLKDNRIECLGFVKDLDTVMYPKDIHIVPWEYNTGTRTRIPVILNYEQVLVATKASVACYPEITEENSVLCLDLETMTKKIIDLYSDRERLHLLANKGKLTFEHTFTTESQTKKLADFLKNILH